MDPLRYREDRCFRDVVWITSDEGRGNVVADGIAAMACCWSTNAWRSLRRGRKRTYEKKMPARRERRIARRVDAGAADAIQADSQDKQSKYPHLNLDFQPELTQLEVFVANAVAVVSSAVIGTIFFLSRSRGKSASGTVGTALSLAFEVLLCAIVFVAARKMTAGLFIEKKESEIMLPPEHLGDPDSLFRDVDGLKVHFKRTVQAGTVPDKVLCCLHGFGANTFSWEAVQDKMSAETKGEVLAMDMPGFGLTERPKELKKYSMGCSGQLAMGLMDLEEQEGTIQKNAKRVLIGHSLGCAAVAAAALADPSHIGALVLVNPAIVATGGAKRKVFSILTKPLVLLQLFTGLIMNSLTALLTPFVLPFLRSLVRSKTFWRRGLQSAWAQPELLTDDTIDGYRRSKLARGWDKGLWKFCRAKLLPASELGGTKENISGSQGSQWQFWKAFNTYMSSAFKAQRSQAEELASIVEMQQMPVLIVHGREDRLVPASNSKRLSTMLMGSEYVELHPCGHVPQEEMPDQFVNIVAAFLGRVLP